MYNRNVFIIPLEKLFTVHTQLFFFSIFYKSDFVGSLLLLAIHFERPLKYDFMEMHFILIINESKKRREKKCRPKKEFSDCHASLNSA